MGHKYRELISCDAPYCNFVYDSETGQQKIRWWSLSGETTSDEEPYSEYYFCSNKCLIQFAVSLTPTLPKAVLQVKSV